MNRSIEEHNNIIRGYKLKAIYAYRPEGNSLSSFARWARGILTHVPEEYRRMAKVDIDSGGDYLLCKILWKEPLND